MAAVNDTLVELTWSSPDPSSGNTVVRVVRSLNAPPSGPDDPNGTVVYEGPAEAATEPTSALLPDMPDAPRTYHYAAYGCTPAQTCETTGSSTTLTLTLTEALVGGGYNVIWRHASADVCSDNLSLGTVATTTTPDWWKSCESNCAIATARQLNATGVMEATAIGQDLASLGVPFGRVLSSEFCRNIQTAELMNLGPTIEERLEITYFVYDEANRCTNTQTLLTLPPSPGQNVALIGHAGFVCPVLESLAWGEAAIYKPDGSGGSELITRVLWDGWMSLP
jgi:phosphohistidine phosphatase SixA